MPGNLLARITAYKGTLVVEAVELDFVHPMWTPAGGDKIGCLVGDTATFLGVSPEALLLLQSIKPGRDAIGDVMWFNANSGLSYFGWLGSNLMLLDPVVVEGDRNYVIRTYVSIPNEVPEGARAAVDAGEVGAVDVEA